MIKSNKIENLVNRYVERHIKDKHLSDDTIKEIKIAYVMAMIPTTPLMLLCNYVEDSFLWMPPFR